MNSFFQSTHMYWVPTLRVLWHLRGLWYPSFPPEFRNSQETDAGVNERVRKYIFIAAVGQRGQAGSHLILNPRIKQTYLARHSECRVPEASLHRAEAGSRNTWGRKEPSWVPTVHGKEGSREREGERVWALAASASLGRCVDGAAGGR